MRKRLDILLTERSLFPTREKAKAAVMAGSVTVDGQRCDKPGTQVEEDALLEVKENTCPYVSRGGLKLEKAIRTFNLDLNGAVCMDIGASTGGFTDCMLQAGAKTVYAVDVGYGQLDYRLRIDLRVVPMERVNIRYLDPDTIPVRFDFIAVDVSFISLKFILPVAAGLLNENGHCLCLVKPQFEAGRDDVGKKGIVRDPSVHMRTIEAVITYANDSGLLPLGLSHSPITGAKGNIEFLLLLSPDAGQTPVFRTDIANVVRHAHTALNEESEHE
ncbi:MAG: TlyA family RNA methyltransferase [Anaerovoracaceae bacterium]